MLNRLQHGFASNVTATHATLASASKAGATGVTHAISSLAVSSDKAGSICLVKDGTTVIWQVQVGAGQYSQSFPAGLHATTGALISVEIDGTSACKANMSVISY